MEEEEEYIPGFYLEESEEEEEPEELISLEEEEEMAPLPGTSYIVQTPSWSQKIKPSRPIKRSIASRLEEERLTKIEQRQFVIQMSEDDKSLLELLKVISDMEIPTGIKDCIVGLFQMDLFARYRYPPLFVAVAEYLCLRRPEVRSISEIINSIHNRYKTYKLNKEDILRYYNLLRRLSK